MLKDQLSPELLAAIQSIVKNNRDQAIEERTKFAEAAQKRYGEIRPVSEALKPHTVPKTDKEKKLAALADDGKKHVITHADVMAGRGVKKEAREEQIDELKKSTLASYAKKATADAVKKTQDAEYEAEYGSPSKSHESERKAEKRVAGVGKAVSRLAKEETDLDEAEKKKASAFDAMAAAVKARQEKEAKEKGTGKFDKKELAPGRTQYTRKSSTYSEEKDTPGQHQCAVHVKHSTMGEGKTLFSQHAEPDEEGNIAWYDVMFEQGIVKQVPTSDLEIVVSESHMNHKKKKSM